MKQLISDPNFQRLTGIIKLILAKLVNVIVYLKILSYLPI